VKEQLAHVPRVDKAPWVTEFGVDPTSWNIDTEDTEDDAGEGNGSGLPGRGLLRDSLRTFADCWGSFDAETAARIFNLPIELVEAATSGMDGPYWEDPDDVVLGDLGTCLQTLAGTRSEGGSITVAEASRLLNQHPTRILEAVGDHCWMYLSGDRNDLEQLWIEQDGE
jgi:hypothetical protein